jgi:predicted SprT family Zn-dependent metalloprotease
MNVERARRLAERLLKKHGLIGWTVGFDRAIRRAGACFFRNRAISLSREFVERNDAAIVIDTIRHEVAHALAWKHDRSTGHDAAWRSWCEVTGAEPTRCFDEEKIVLPPARYRCTVLKTEVEWRRGRRTGTVSIELKKGEVFSRYRLSPHLRWLAEVGLVAVLDTRTGRRVS